MIRLCPKLLPGALLALLTFACTDNINAGLLDGGTSGRGATGASSGTAGASAGTSGTTSSGGSGTGTTGATGGTSAIAIDFDVEASNEIGIDAGFCAAPLVGDGGVVKQSGLLELDPQLNPNPAYLLELQVQNDLAPTPQGGNDFHPQTATITYDDIEGSLSGPALDRALVSGDVPAGGSEVIAVKAVGSFETTAWVSSFEMNNLVSEDVALKVSLEGTLGSGTQLTSAVFDFPLTLCFGCNNLPLSLVTANQMNTYPATCPSAQVAAVVGQGPCGSPQDFSFACEPCGASGQACCSGQGCNGTLCSQGICNGSLSCGADLRCQ